MRNRTRFFENLRENIFPFGIAVVLAAVLLGLSWLRILPFPAFFLIMFILSFGTKVLNAVQTRKDDGDPLIRQFVAYLRSPADSLFDMAFLGQAVNGFFFHNDVADVALSIIIALSLGIQFFAYISKRRRHTHSFVLLPLKVKSPEDEQLN